jgi:hypothetical protein
VVKILNKWKTHPIPILIQMDDLMERGNNSQMETHAWFAVERNVGVHSPFLYSHEPHWILSEHDGYGQEGFEISNLFVFFPHLALRSSKDLICAHDCYHNWRVDHDGRSM